MAPDQGHDAHFERVTLFHRVPAVVGHMFRVGSHDYRFDMVAAPNAEEAEQLLRKRLRTEETMTSQPLSSQVFAWMGMKLGDIRPWEVGARSDC